MVPTDKRHRDLSRLSNGNHRRIGAFVVKMRGDSTDQNAGGADPDYRPPAAEQIGDMRLRPAEMVRRIRAAQRMAMDIGVNLRGQFARQRQASGGQAQDDGLRRGGCGG